MSWKPLTEKEWKLTNTNPQDRDYDDGADAANDDDEEEEDC